MLRRQGVRTPLPTGAVETGENLSPGSAGSFSEVLAAQTHDGQQRPVLAHTDSQQLTEDGSDAELSESESSPTDSTAIVPEAETSEVSLSSGDSGKALRVALLGDSPELPSGGIPDPAIGKSLNPASASTDLSAETVPSARAATEGVAARGAEGAEGSEDSDGQGPKVTQGVPNASPNGAGSLAPRVGQRPATLNVQTPPSPGSPVVLQAIPTVTTTPASQTAIDSSIIGVSGVKPIPS